MKQPISICFRVAQINWGNWDITVLTFIRNWIEFVSWVCAYERARLFVFPNLVNPLDIIFCVTKFMGFVCAVRAARIRRKTKQNFRISLNKSINHDRADKLIKTGAFEISCEMHIVNSFCCLYKPKSSWCCGAVEHGNVSKWKIKTRFSISSHRPKFKWFQCF